MASELNFISAKGAGVSFEASTAEKVYQSNVNSMVRLPLIKANSIEIEKPDLGIDEYQDP